MPVFYYGRGVAKERFTELMNNPPPVMAVDVETVSLTERMPIGFAIAFSPSESLYFQVYPDPPPELTLLRPFFHNPKVKKVLHNAMFDLSVLPMIPYMEGFDRSNIFDTNVAARLLGRTITDLPFLAATELGRDVTPAKLMMLHSKTMLDVDQHQLADKCRRDAEATFELYLNYEPQIQPDSNEYFKVEMQVIPVLIDLSLRGLAIDQKARAQLEAQLEDEVEFYRRLLESAGIKKPGSTQQVGIILGERGNFLPFTRSKRQLSTREGDLGFLDDPIATAVLGWRAKSKLLSTYIRPIKDQPRFYTEYYLDTAVGRLNSRNRNIQNIPADCRKMLLPDNGCFTSMDYSKEHMYILAHMSQDRDLLRILYDPDPKKADVHQHTAERMGVTRKLAKTLNYAVAYGATDRTISEQAHIKDRRLCSKLLDDWFRAYPGAADWVIYAQREGLRDHWSLPTVFGRRIAIPDEFTEYGRLNTDGMKRKAVNYPILGSDGEVIKRAILLCSAKKLGPPIMAITVHDSIDFDGDIEVPKDELENITPFRIPIEVKKTFTWD